MHNESNRMQDNDLATRTHGAAPALKREWPHPFHAATALGGAQMSRNSCANAERAFFSGSDANHVCKTYLCMTTLIGDAIRKQRSRRDAENSRNL
jgi:hypothetical protein